LAVILTHVRHPFSFVSCSPPLLSLVDGKFQSQNPMHQEIPQRSTHNLQRTTTQPKAKPSRMVHRTSAVTTTQPKAKPSRMVHRASAVTCTTVHRTGGVAEYSGAYWKKHSDGMKTPFVIKYAFGLRTVANHSTDRCCRSYWQFMIRNVRLPYFSPLGISDPARRTHTLYSKY